jgi:toxin ParE1/3/4
MKPVVFHRDAERELDDGMAYYESRREGLGLAFQAEVERIVNVIQQAPERWPVYRNTLFRRHLLKRFPYAVCYLELDHCIWIAAVAHQKRKPGYWSRRQPE